MKGMSYNPLTQVYSLNNDLDVNYMIAVRKWVVHQVPIKRSSLI
jgi:2-polyprenyl-3-methyl-5-hydroxy-6-metoxy-1,4-benzoquinol methylase